MPEDTNELLRFAKLVKLCRAAQLRVIRDKDHSPAAIRQVRDAERRVDKAIAWIEEHRRPTLPGHDGRRGPGAYGRGGGGR